MRAVGGKIPDELQLETRPRAVVTGVTVVGVGLVRDQRATGEFSDELVEAAARLVRNWAPEPRPTWVTCVPSSRAPELVDVVRPTRCRRAPALRIPGGHEGARDRSPGRDGEHVPSSTATSQAAFAVVEPVPAGPVLLVDDIVDSRWTLTEVGGVLRAAGVTAVIPLTLAQGSSD